jgi:hypothetical protein
MYEPALLDVTDDMLLTYAPGLHKPHTAMARSQFSSGQEQRKSPDPDFV